jgi:hypothetical protein
MSSKHYAEEFRIEAGEADHRAALPVAGITARPGVSQHSLYKW